MVGSCVYLEGVADVSVFAKDEVHATIADSASCGLAPAGDLFSSDAGKPDGDLAG